MPDKVEDHRKAVENAADIVGKVWLSQIGVLFYVGLAVAAVTHVDLLLQHGVKLPFLSIELSLTAFFFLGPVIVILSHAYVLYHLTILDDRMATFLAAVKNSWTRAEQVAQLPVNLFVQILAASPDARRAPYWIATIVALATLAIGPVCLLVLFELQFLPYHSEWLTWWARASVMIDLGLVWWFCRNVSRIETIGWHWPQWAAVSLFTTATLYVVLAVATFPGETLETVLPAIPLHETLVSGSYDSDLHVQRTLWSNRLFAAGVILPDVDRYDTPETRATAPVSQSFRGRHLEYAVLTEAQLGRADFTGAHLNGASLVRVHAQGSWFNEADLAGAQLDSAELAGASFYAAHMPGATLAETDLQGASLAGADMRAAWLPKANLQGASLATADLRRATLDGANLAGTSLKTTQLQGASLAGANLEAAAMVRTHLWKADVSRASYGHGIRIADPDEETFDTTCTGTNCDPAETPETIRKMIERNVPDGASRVGMLQRLFIQLHDHQPESWEPELKQLKSPAHALNNDKRPEVWSKIVCAGKGAPYVLQLLVDTYNDDDGADDENWSRPLTQKDTDTLVHSITGPDKATDKTGEPAGCAARLALGTKLRMDVMDLKRPDKPVGEQAAKVTGSGPVSNLGSSPKK